MLIFKSKSEYNNVVDITFYRSKNDGNLLLVKKKWEDLEKSLSEFHFDEYFDEVYRNDRGASWQILEWGAKLSKNLSDMKDTIFSSKSSDIYLPFTNGAAKKEKMDFTLTTETKKEVKRTLSDSFEEFEVISETEIFGENKISDKDMEILNEEVDWSRDSEKPIDAEKWKSLFDEKGKMKDPTRFKRDVFYGVCLARLYLILFLGSGR